MKKMKKTKKNMTMTLKKRSRRSETIAIKIKKGSQEGFAPLPFPLSPDARSGVEQA